VRPKREVIVDCRVPILSVELVLWSLDFGSNGVIDTGIYCHLRSLDTSLLDRIIRNA